MLYEYTIKKKYLRKQRVEIEADDAFEAGQRCRSRHGVTMDEIISVRELGPRSVTNPAKYDSHTWKGRDCSAPKKKSAKMKIFNRRIEKD